MMLQNKKKFYSPRTIKLLQGLASSISSTLEKMDDPNTQEYGRNQLQEPYEYCVLFRDEVMQKGNNMATTRTKSNKRKWESK